MPGFVLSALFEWDKNADYFTCIEAEGGFPWQCAQG